MKAAQLERLHEQMAKLRLTKSQERLEALLQPAPDVDALRRALDDRGDGRLDQFSRYR